MNRWWIYLLMVVTLVPGSRVCPSTGDEIRKRQVELQALRDQIRDYEQKIKRQQQNEKATLELLDTYDRKATAVRRLITRLRVEEHDIENAIDSTRQDLARLAEHAVRRGCPQLSALLQAGLGTAQRWPRRSLPSVWAGAFFALLLEIGWPGEDLDSAEHQARQRWQALLGDFGGHDDVLGPVGAGQALSLLRDLADATLFEPQEIRAPLVVIDPETCAGMHFDAIWVCGLDAAQWPPPAAPDQFLPRAWQARRTVPGATAEIAAAQARRTLDRLRGSALEVVLSVPLFEDEAPLLPSALLADINPIPAPDLWTNPSPARTAFAARPPLVVTVTPPVVQV